MYANSSNYQASLEFELNSMKFASLAHLELRKPLGTERPIFDNENSSYYDYSCVIFSHPRKYRAVSAANRKRRRDLTFKECLMPGKSRH